VLDCFCTVIYPDLEYACLAWNSSLWLLGERRELPWAPKSNLMDFKCHRTHLVRGILGHGFRALSPKSAYGAFVMAVSHNISRSGWVSLFTDMLQLLSLMLYASSSSSSSSSDHAVSSDLLDSIAAVKPLEDEVESDETDSIDLLNGIQDENIREAFRVRWTVLLKRLKVVHRS